jgi:hypothetical protein
VRLTLSFQVQYYRRCAEKTQIERLNLLAKLCPPAAQLTFFSESHGCTSPPRRCASLPSRRSNNSLSAADRTSDCVAMTPLPPTSTPDQITISLHNPSLLKSLPCSRPHLTCKSVEWPVMDMVVVDSFLKSVHAESLEPCPHMCLEVLSCSRLLPTSSKAAGTVTQL